MAELILGSIIGAIVSISIAEIYHRRNSGDTQRKMKELAMMYDDLIYMIGRAKEEAENAGRKAEEAWEATVAGTPADPDFPFK